MKKYFLFLFSLISMTVSAEINFERPSTEKICLTGMKDNSHFDEFVRVVHTNQMMMNLPKSRLGLLSTVFIKMDRDHDGRLADAEMPAKCAPCQQ